MSTVSHLGLSLAQVLVEAAAIVAFALSGLIEAARKRLDAVGVVVVAGLTAFGGGTLRDVLLDRRPFFWVQHANWLWALLALCVAAMLFMRARHLQITARAMQWPDALGMGLFAATGTQLAVQMQMPAIVAVLMGVATAVCGGVLRDMVCNEIPSAFRDHRPYALCAFVGGWVLVIVTLLGGSDETALVLAAGVAAALRVAVLLGDYSLPAWTAGEGDERLE
ncbi:MAG: trimeric intracellular cation channel family protein [Burkholderiales bacterium]|nr:trimeric intracellular cation channel family protein [Burkholderiales bacterium]